ncbi:MAG: FtsX-like permease family protein [Bacteroidetes bacterium]|jgi:putative ABC transport system permease protein|nr:FtsX-like permease family protein [Bacteroidota bacterium]
MSRGASNGSRVVFYLGYAARSLRRSGQRAVLGVACIAFGVLALTGLQLLAGMIEDALLVSPRLQLGGDLRLEREGPIAQREWPVLDSLLRDGQVQAYTSVAPVSAGFLRTEGSGRLYLVSRTLGVDPTSYPVLGHVDLRGGATLAQALEGLRRAVLSQDLARHLALGPGDAFSLSGGLGHRPVRLTVGGIAEQLPDRKGSTILFSLETAQRLVGQPDVVRYVNVAVPAPGQETVVEARVQSAGWTARHPQQDHSDIARIFGFALPAAGLLGLLIGGIGVANTIQVMLSRRTTEIAALKAMGYRRRDLLALFGIEAAMLGGIGGILGVAGAIGLAAWLRRVVMDALPFLLDFHVEPLYLAGGVLAGVLTAVIFGAVAILRASDVRPAVLLRQLPTTPTRRTRMVTVGLYAGLFVLFGGLGSLLVGSLIQGFGAIAGGLVGVVVFGSLLGLALLAVVRVPVPGFPLLGMAQRNLRHRPVRSVAALVALFVGVLAIGLAASSMQNARQQVDARYVSFGAYNLLAFGQPADSSALRTALQDIDAEVVTSTFANVQVTGPGDRPLLMLTTLDGRDAAHVTWNVELVEGTWTGASDEAFAPARLRDVSPSLTRGDTLEVATGELRKSLVVAGFYEPEAGAFMARARGLLVPRETALAMGGEQAAAAFSVAAPSGRLDAVADRVGAALPEAMVITSADVNDYLVRVYEGLFLFVVAIAGLSFVAGMVLIANAVGLAMVERRRELGVLKAIGYSAWHVLGTILLENGLLGLIAGGLGILAVWGVLQGLERLWDLSLVLDPSLAAGMVLLAIALALSSAALVAWRPTHVRPLFVLRAE